MLLPTLLRRKPLLPLESKGRTCLGCTCLEVVSEVQDREEAIACCRELRPDLVLMDASMPRMNGIEATSKIKAQFPETNVLILTAHADHRLATRRPTR